MRKLIKDERGNGPIVFIIAAVLLMFIFMSTMEPVVMAFKQQVLEQAKMKGLDQMQVNGQLTASIEQGIRDYLTARGFNDADLRISGTLAKANWGEEVSLEIEYDDTIKTYQRTGLLTFNRVIENITYEAFGSTTSYTYDNN